MKKFSSSIVDNFFRILFNSILFAACDEILHSDIFSFEKQRFKMSGNGKTQNRIHDCKLPDNNSDVFIRYFATFHVQQRLFYFWNIFLRSIEHESFIGSHFHYPEHFVEAKSSKVSKLKIERSISTLCNIKSIWIVDWTSVTFPTRASACLQQNILDAINFLIFRILCYLLVTSLRKSGSMHEKLIPVDVRWSLSRMGFVPSTANTKASIKYSQHLGPFSNYFRLGNKCLRGRKTRLITLKWLHTEFK